MALLRVPAKQRVRKLRRDLTDAERRLWSRLRDHQLGGWSFRRQHSIAPYIVDFACVEAKLIVEIDGGQHADSMRDQTRNNYLTKKGWHVLRFWNNDALTNTEGVLSTLLAALGPHPNPPPSATPPGEGTRG